MHSISQRLLIATKWLASFLHPQWLPHHYPISVRAQSGAGPEAAWFARVLNWPGPTGLGATDVEARAALATNLVQIQNARRSNGQQMPRPGARVQIEFASTSRVEARPEILDDFIVNVLGFSLSDPVFISDESSIEDFGDSEEISRIRSRIQEHYGIAIDERGPNFIADILEKARAKNEV